TPITSGVFAARACSRSWFSAAAPPTSARAGNAVRSRSIVAPTALLDGRRGPVAVRADLDRRHLRAPRRSRFDQTNAGPVPYRASVAGRDGTDRMKCRVVLTLAAFSATALELEPLQCERVDGDDDARTGHGDGGDLRPEGEAPGLEDTGGDRQRERV